MSRFYALTVQTIQRITPKSVTVVFQVPENLQNTFSFIAGQYITIKKEIDGQEVRRSYSICSTPSSNRLIIGVKEMKDGRFSSYVNNTLKEGDVLEVHPPEGRFVFVPKKKKKRNYAAFAAGSGITPVMSIMKTVLEEEPKSHFVLVYGNKNSSDTMFYNEIRALLKEYPHRLSVYFTFTQTQEEDMLFGRISHATVNYILKNKHKKQRFNTFYLCGPETMIKTVSETLQTNKTPKEDIFFELFTASDDKQTPINTDGKTNVMMMVDDVETSFVMDKKQRVLDAALKEGIDAPYSCQGGVCSSCMARLKEGEVTLVQNQILTDSELEEGFILTCQAHPVTDYIVVDYDDI